MKIMCVINYWFDVPKHWKRLKQSAKRGLSGCAPMAFTNYSLQKIWKFDCRYFDSKWFFETWHSVVFFGWNQYTVLQHSIRKNGEKKNVIVISSNVTYLVTMFFFSNYVHALIGFQCFSIYDWGKIDFNKIASIFW